ncbi:glycosyltransferase [Agromyces sp. LHK192]|uniref:glycosyltransferase n=1 Tax=Agromyces sp. LHK192 TaxID=2498704 RepID=UPI0013E2B53E|nr:glycosyltransferase [Agromyces sp. LHK192]
MRQPIQIAVGIATIILLTWSVVANWDVFAPAVLAMDPWAVLGAGFSILVGLYLNMLSWRSVVRALGSRLGLGAAARVFFVSQLTKYLPGGIWPIVVSARTGRAAGLAPRVSVTSMTVALLIGVTIGAVISTGALLLVPAIREDYWWAPAGLLAIGAVLLTPPILDRVIGFAMRLTRRGTIPTLRRGPFAAAIGWSVASWILLGSGLGLLAHAAVGLDGSEFLLAIASYAFAWVCGFVAVIAPAGAGVREIVLLLTLGTFLPPQVVLSVVVVDRVLMTLGDVAMLVFTVPAHGRRGAIAPDRPAPLFVTRKFAPSVGGMETLAVNIDRALREVDPRTQVLALGRSNAHLLWWIPTTALRLASRLLRDRHRVVLFGDALTWALLAWIPRCLRVPALPMAHGLDVTYDHVAYRMLVRPALRKAPRVIANSTATREALIAIGVEPARVELVVLGIPAPAVPSLTRQEASGLVRERYDLRPSDVILVTTGRLIRRKGVSWFIAEVLPSLDPRCVYLVLGDGDQRQRIGDTVSAHGLEDRVRLLGRVSDAERAEVLHGADLYVQPNVDVPGDVEGFGLVVVESSQAGLLTIAADREGLVDAVRDGVTGFRVPSGDPGAWIARIESIIDDPERDDVAREFQAAARDIYSLERMGDRLVELLQSVAVPASGSGGHRG